MLINQGLRINGLSRYWYMHQPGIRQHKHHEVHSRLLPPIITPRNSPPSTWHCTPGTISTTGSYNAAAWSWFHPLTLECSAAPNDQKQPVHQPLPSTSAWLSLLTSLDRFAATEWYKHDTHPASCSGHLIKLTCKPRFLACADICSRYCVTNLILWQSYARSSRCRYRITIWS